MTKQEQLQRFDNLVAKLRKTLEDKGHDYASEDILSNFKDSGQRIGKTPEEQCLTLISVKVSRLSNLLSDKNKIPKNEAIQDSILDLIGYSFLLDCITVEKPKVTFKQVDESEFWEKVEKQLMEEMHKKQQRDLGFMLDATIVTGQSLGVDAFPNSFKTPEQVLREGLEKEIEKLRSPHINTQQNLDDMTKVFGGPASHLNSLNIKDYIIDQPKDVDCDGNVSSVTDKMKPFQTLSSISSEMTTKLQEEREEILKDLVGDVLVLAMFRPLLEKEEFLKQNRLLVPRIERVIQIEKYLGLETKESEKLLQEIKEKTK